MSCMMENEIPVIIRGTTPTIKFCFSDVDVEEITTAYITVKQHEETIIDKDITDAYKVENTLLWTLTQEDTLSLKSKVSATVLCDWKLVSGLRGISHELTVQVKDPGKEGVI